MNHNEKTKEQLINDIETLEKRIKSLEDQDSLKYRLAIEELVTNISTRFINIMPQEVDKEIDCALKNIGEFIKVERCFIDLYSKDLTNIEKTYEWCADGVEPRSEKFKELSLEPFLLKMNEPGYFGYASDKNSMEKVTEKEIWVAHDIKSLLGIPMVLGKTLIGLFGFSLERTKKIWKDEDIRLLKLLGEIFVNVIGRKKSEDLIRQEQHIFRNGPVIVFKREALYGWPVEYVSPNINQLGYKQKDFLNRKILYSNIIHPDDVRRVTAEVEEYSESGKSQFEQEYRIKLPNGDTRWIYDITHIIRDNSEAITGYHGYILDITDKKSAEEEHRQFEINLQHSQKFESLGLMAGGIAHDFNNLLTGILGYADVALMDLKPGSSTYESVQEIVTSSCRLAEITKQMLIYAGKAKSVIQSINLSDLARDMSTLLEVSISKKSVLKFNLRQNLPSIRGDITQIRQVIMNLVINASEAIGDKSGEIIINTGIMKVTGKYLSNSYINEKLPGGNYVYIEVSDTGSGINEENLFKIFDPFFTTKSLGRGLGLAAVMGIVRSHNGTIKINSSAGSGSSFKVLFPALSQAHEKSGETPQNAKTNRGSGTILVIDDELPVRKIAKKLLEHAGFNVITASDGEEGVEVFSEHINEINAVLLDATMPRMDGKETLDALRNIKSDVKIILSSGYNAHEVMNDFVWRDISGFIQKPYRVKEVVETINKVIRDE